MISVTMGRKFLCCLFLVSFSMPVSGMWVIKPWTWFGSKPVVVEDVKAINLLETQNTVEEVIENKEVLQGEVSVKVQDKDESEFLEIINAMQQNETPELHKFDNKTSQELIETYLKVLLGNKFENLSGKGTTNHFMVKPDKKSLGALIGNFVCGSFDETIMFEARNFFGKELYSVLLDNDIQESSDLLKNYSSTSLLMMRSKLDFINSEEQELQDFVVVDVQNTSTLGQWYEAYAGKHFKQDKLDAFIRDFGSIIENKNIRLFVGLYAQNKDKPEYKACVASFFVVDDATAHLVRFNNLINGDDKDVRALCMMQKSLAMIKKDSDVKEVLVLSNSHQEAVFASLGLIKTQQLLRCVKNK